MSARAELHRLTSNALSRRAALNVLALRSSHACLCNREYGVRRESLFHDEAAKQHLLFRLAVFKHNRATPTVCRMRNGFTVWFVSVQVPGFRFAYGPYRSVRFLQFMCKTLAYRVPASRVLELRERLTALLGLHKTTRHESVSLPSCGNRRVTV